jgi:putative membrane protein
MMNISQIRSTSPGRKTGKKTISIAAAIMLCAGTGVAQMRSGAPAGQTAGQTSQNPSMDPQMNNMQGPNQPSPQDRMFVKNAMQGSMAEVQLGQLTLQKSQNEQVKQFAQRMIDDHTKLNEQMKPVAQQIGVDAPSQVSKKDKAIMTKLQGLSGTAYDQAYLKDMVKDHKQDLNEFQMESSAGQDQIVKDAANQGSKVIATHLQMAQQLAKDQNVTMVGQ